MTNLRQTALVQESLAEMGRVQVEVGTADHMTRPLLIQQAMSHQDSRKKSVTTEMKYLMLAIVLIALTAVAASSLVITNNAVAKISCQNPGGQEPQGNCQGANENVNPSGKAPPGQN